MKVYDMPHHPENTTYDDPIQLILDHGIDGLKPAFKLLLNITSYETEATWSVFISTRLSEFRMSYRRY